MTMVGTGIGTSFRGSYPPWYETGKADGIHPTLWSDFINNRHMVNGQLVSFTDVYTFTRASTATYFDSAGVMQTASSGSPRFTYNPITLERAGLMMESSRINLVLNSATGSNQTITTTATSYALSFYGTGTVTLSGTHTATVNGLGSYPTVTTLIFIPTAGSLNIDVTGTVQYIQIEAGLFPTSYIPTTGSAVTRSADVCTNNSSNVVGFSWYDVSGGTLMSTSSMVNLGTDTGSHSIAVISNGTTSQLADLRIRVSGVQNCVVVNTSTQFSTNSTGIGVSGAKTKIAMAFKLNDFNRAENGSIATDDTSGTLPTVDRLGIGGRGTSAVLNGSIAECRFYPTRVSNSELQRLTSL